MFSLLSTFVVAIFLIVNVSLVARLEARTWKTTFVRKSWTVNALDITPGDGYINSLTTPLDTVLAVTALLGRNRSSVVMPLTVRLALCMLLDHASGPARDEISARLDFQRNYKSCNVEVPTIVDVLQRSTFLVINKVYAPSGDVAPAFAHAPTAAYGLHVEPYRPDRAHLATMYINQWFEKASLHSVQELLQPGDIGASSSLLLLSAAHVQSTWYRNFRIIDTKTGVFRGPLKKMYHIPMMTSEVTGWYFEDSGFGFQMASVQLYTMGTLMTIILPEQPARNVPQLLYQFQGLRTFEEARRNISTRSFRLTLPRFKLHTSINLNDALKKLEIKQIFNKSSSGLTGVVRGGAGGGAPHVSLVQQGVFFEMSEYGAHLHMAEGEEVYVRPALRPTPPASDKKLAHVLADHPFIFAVEVPVAADGDHVTLLMGVFYGPDE